MNNLLNNLNDFEGRRLFNLLGAIFVVFLIVGFSVGYIINQSSPNQNHDPLSSDQTQEVSYEGRIVYVDPQLYPEDDISYYLEDNNGKRIILLSARDQKLVVSEGLWATLYGVEKETLEGEEVLLVDRVVLTQSN